MSSVPMAVADAVKDELVGASLSIVFAPERAYTPPFDLKEMDGLKVVVIPKDTTISALDRARNSSEISVDVGVLRKVRDMTPAAIDPLADFVQEVIDFLDRRKLDAYPSAKWMRTANAPLYAPDWLKEKLMFVSVITVTYMVSR